MLSYVWLMQGSESMLCVRVRMPIVHLHEQWTKTINTWCSLIHQFSLLIHASEEEKKQKATPKHSPSTGWVFVYSLCPFGCNICARVHLVHSHESKVNIWYSSQNNKIANVSRIRLNENVNPSHASKLDGNHVLLFSFFPLLSRCRPVLIVIYYVKQSRIMAIQYASCRVWRLCW